MTAEAGKGMIILVGYAALWLALILATGSALATALGGRLGRPSWVSRGENALFAVAGFLALASAILLHLLLSHNFQVQYVYAHTSSYQATPYVFSALWAGQEGSLLLWALLLSAVTVVLILQKRHCPAALWPYTLATLAITEGFFALLLVTVQNPFILLPMRPAEGAGITPLLENPAMVIHPPILFLGYATFAVPFAMTMASLIAGQMEASWLRWIRRWSLMAWLFLGLGIAIGAWWAYVELGWGGYWSWDPVENASLIPWLTGTAYLHSIMAQERWNIFKRWNSALAIATFVLCIFGTLVTRGGIIISDLHGFAQQIQPIAYYLIGFMLAVTIASGILFYLRRRQLEDSAGPDQLLSRESSLLVTNLLFVGLAAAIMVGMLFPNIAQALGGTKIYLGGAFYGRVFAPLALIVVLLIGVCPLLGWRQSTLPKLRERLQYPAILAVALMLLLFVLRIRHPLALLSFGVIAFAASALVGDLARQVVARSRLRAESVWSAAASLFHHNRRQYGAKLVHLSILLIAIAIAGSSLYKTETVVALAQGEARTVRSYTLQYEGSQVVDEPGRRRFVATVGVYSGPTRIGTLKPEKNLHWNIEQYVTEVALRTTLAEDLYVALDWPEQGGVATFRISVYPLVIWLWIGAGLLLVGTLIAFWPTASEQREMPSDADSA
jgi:cytochrome c-type biogenesis protein CcmF